MKQGLNADQRQNLFDCAFDRYVLKPGDITDEDLIVLMVFAQYSEMIFNYQTIYNSVNSRKRYELYRVQSLQAGGNSTFNH